MIEGTIVSSIRPGKDKDGSQPARRARIRFLM